MEKKSNMKKWLLLFVSVSVLSACHRPMHVAESQGEIIMIDSTVDALQDTT